MKVKQRDAELVEAGVLAWWQCERIRARVALLAAPPRPRPVPFGRAVAPASDRWWVLSAVVLAIAAVLSRVR
ncbi:hypothetical protein HRbin27_01956 [bacterium HR27]|nr:hypothetical protein HRbin27_01956 [bacterium HR27]